jgi:methyl-accepting chemotaxis protein
MKSWFGRMRLWQKLVLIVGLSTVVSGLALYLYIDESGKAIRSAQRQQRGIRPAQLMIETLERVQQHRALVVDAATNPARRGELPAKRAEVDAAIATADREVMADITDEKLKGAWDRVRQSWTELAAAAANLPPAQSFARHSAVAGQLLVIDDRVADRYGLALDPNADTYHLVIATFTHGPALLEELGKLRVRAVEVIAGAATATPAQATELRGQIAALAERASERSDMLQDEIGKAMGLNTHFHDALADDLKRAGSAAGKAIDLVSDGIVQYGEIKVKPEEIESAVGDAAALQSKVYAGSVSLLQEVLQSRVDHLRHMQIVMSAIVCAVWLASCLAGWWVIRSINLSFAHAVGLAGKIAAGDLSARTEVAGDDEVAHLLRELARMTAGLSAIVADVRSGAAGISAASSQIAAGNADLSRRTEEQAGALENTSSSMTELMGTVKHNVDRLAQACMLSEGASDVAVRGGQVIEQVVSTMGEIKKSSERIVDIISVIDGIAFQTNILALNAAVEAARAGEQGRGFAVVATEVRSLAQRSAAAAKEIKRLIEDSVSKVHDGTGLVGDAGKTMRDIVDSVREVATIMTEISERSREQGDSIDNVGRLVEKLDQAGQQNAAMVEEVATAAASLQDQAQRLAESTHRFVLRDDQVASFAAGAPADPRATHPAQAGAPPTTAQDPADAMPNDAPFDADDAASIEPRAEAPRHDESERAGGPEQETRARPGPRKALRTGTDDEDWEEF